SDGIDLVSRAQAARAPPSPADGPAAVRHPPALDPRGQQVPPGGRDGDPEEPRVSQATRRVVRDAALARAPGALRGRLRVRQGSARTRGAGVPRERGCELGPTMTERSPDGERYCSADSASRSLELCGSISRPRWNMLLALGGWPSWRWILPSAQ